MYLLSNFAHFQKTILLLHFVWLCFCIAWYLFLYCTCKWPHRQNGSNDFKKQCRYFHSVQRIRRSGCWRSNWKGEGKEKGRARKNGIEFVNQSKYIAIQYMVGLMILRQNILHCEKWLDLLLDISTHRFWFQDFCGWNLLV